MKNLFLYLALLLLCTPSVSFAQYKIVSFDYERAAFNENQVLPAETHILIQATVPDYITYVEIAVFDAKGKAERRPNMIAIWKRPSDKIVDKISLPLHYKLRGSSEYDFEVSYFTPILAAEKETITKQLYQHLDAYIEQTLQASKSHIQLTRSSRQMLSDLNSIVKKGLENYRNRTAIEFKGFSDLVKNNLEQLEKVNLTSGRFIFTGKSKEEAKSEYRKKLVKDLETLLHSELDPILNTELAKLKDTRYINDYATEKVRRTIAIQGGYGGVYVNGNFSNLTLGSAPYAGLAFPLGRKTFAPKILSNTSICFGAYFTNLKGLGLNNGDLSGPIFKRPTYIGLSYKIYQFINLNVGATFLEDASTAGQISGLGSSVFVRPNLGISVQFQFWADLSR